MLSTTTQAHAILGGINENKTHKNNSNLNLADREASYKAEETPISADTGIENMGIAVFKEDKLVRRIIWYGIFMSFNYNR